MTERPEFIRHWRDLETEDDGSYSGDTELLSIGGDDGKARAPGV